MRCDCCPRYCRVDRDAGEIGFCGAGSVPRVALSDLHLWEEPPISGTKGSGAVFFCDCNLRCVFCQNHLISQGPVEGRAMDEASLALAFTDLARRGAHNINLVSPTHFSPAVARAMRLAREQGLTLPFVYNSNGYDSLETLDRMDGLVDIYLPDLKYFSDSLAQKYSSAPSYFANASRAILEMASQVGPPEMGEDGLLRKGLVVRHLVLPGCVDDSISVLRWIAQNVPKGTYVSVMAQYYPCHLAKSFPEIDRTLTQKEYDRVLDEVFSLDLLDGFVQELSSAKPEYTPDFYPPNCGFK
jgi:putative pyruvate formate lyase activating enzyme